MDKNIIYAVDDEQSIRELYTCALENAGFIARCYDSGEKMLEALDISLPDLIILDIMLDGIDGYKILEKLKQDNRLQHIPVIMISAKGEEISKVKGLNLGADDYISKPFGVLELIARIKANLRKSQSASVSNRYKDIVICEETFTISVSDNNIKCSLKEYNLLKLLVENAEKVVQREKIFSDVWGEDFYGETRTLDMHIKTLRHKLADMGSTAVIETVRGVGYLLK